jgi:hypothetical protein
MIVRGKNGQWVFSLRAAREYFWSTPLLRKKYAKTQFLRRETMVTARGIPDNIRESLGRSIYRVIFVANNKAITSINPLVDSITPNDLIVQYNGCRYYEMFKRSECWKLFVFRADGHTGVNFGFSKKVARFSHVNLGEATNDKIAVLFIDNVPNTNKAPRGLENISKESRACSVVDTSSKIFKSYPTPEGIDFAGPSSGFVTLVLFLQARKDLQCAGARQFEIVLCGFSDVCDGEFWNGHNWTHEREFIMGLADRATLVT